MGGRKSSAMNSTLEVKFAEDGVLSSSRNSTLEMEFAGDGALNRSLAGERRGSKIMSSRSGNSGLRPLAGGDTGE